MKKCLWSIIVLVSISSVARSEGYDFKIIENSTGAKKLLFFNPENNDPVKPPELDRVLLEDILNEGKLSVHNEIEDELNYRKQRHIPDGQSMYSQFTDLSKSKIIFTGGRIEPSETLTVNVPQFSVVRGAICTGLNGEGKGPVQITAKYPPSDKPGSEFQVHNDDSNHEWGYVCVVIGDPY